jgi:hypothetical protein
MTADLTDLPAAQLKLAQAQVPAVKFSVRPLVD